MEQGQCNTSNISDISGNISGKPYTGHRRAAACAALQSCCGYATGGVQETRWAGAAAEHLQQQERPNCRG